MSDPKVTLFLQNGQEGVDYNMVNGVPKQTGTTNSGEKMMTVANNLDYDILSNGIELGDQKRMMQQFLQDIPVMKRKQRML